MKNLSILLPTRDRPSLMQQLLESIIKMTSDSNSIELIVYTDESDKESFPLIYPAVSITRVSGRENNMADIMNVCYKASTGRFVMLANDDMIIRKKGWDKRVLEEFLNFPDDLALVYGNDLYYGKRMATFPILSRTACELMGGICSQGYKSHGIDSHLFDIFNRLENLGHNRLIYLADVVLEHMHYSLTEKLFDHSLELKGKNKDSVYSSYADERQDIALKMAKFIESKKSK